MKKFILCLVVTVSWQISSAGIFEQGMQSFEQKNYAQAKKLWQPLAKEGDSRAQYNLALILFKYEKNKTAKNQLLKQQANQYLTMSRDNGLVDSYLLKTPVDVKTDNIGPLVKNDETNLAIIDSLSWLKQQQRKYYTLQLATGKSRDSMEVSKEKLVASQLLEQPENLYIQEFKRKRENKIIISYVLIYGSFQSYQLAKNEVEKLPESIQKSSPWIRQFGTLQDKVNGNKKK
ncbi:MAG: hypothetical protein KZQ64_07035 [gamma proteobacterium symbiont of Bathyaustriella thionipta]|nr:hypothetical protein [gamma proteobacterium symbiont of Bathyaustriella thionipta]MCU7951404.1 hypothetical protein [gamma proteobacterium symbiont of Bathyaustriella thionipta]MCU7953128.1 hypothetical protein [gamma proteobacterium symbiont of Bathyaustriella thionipta]MCU7957956.1 hypothetical protein [gamma proteobacterium symbiont of Bathyaustriella thionipta]MCU7967771.1 hypothetical protein [gamma proteobacterium symbiont of Bathyaustriella thionipta]